MDASIIDHGVKATPLGNDRGHGSVYFFRYTDIGLAGEAVWPQLVG